MHSQRLAPDLNHLLRGLPRDDWEAISNHLELVRLRPGQLLTDCGQHTNHVYFPTTAVVSMLSFLEDATTVEIATAGNEGMVGIPVVTGGNAMPYRLEVHTPGFGYRLAANKLRQELLRSPAILRLTLLYVQALLTQIAQTAVCNRYHSLNQQVCRWLLLAVDRLCSNEIAITQQVIATKLGVRREGVTEAARKLADLGLIHYSRGHITVIDRVRLELHACECYGLVRREYGRLLYTGDNGPALPERVGHARALAVCAHHAH
ncbi:Crp/Fnr family transcriptional regulator [Cupriavidus basilensis]|uniref:cAMP-binding protein-catabolite gene activator and regulatory subunit of cAMP-dependent protein kinase n=1 Tax=Cupriavidus basilensis TaxID=68895 RepID=A0A0C4YR08_9BURK|nr:Crp/Fnr family transcriptional regulator [Cupriavidus basilensis]AJG24439.1 cAMP-binding protein - catabolite gene activator and regulatory subunit of cAMP-dependent protein kinase [Cupriavidus basilensis]